jgi:hypothetical protein
MKLSEIMEEANLITDESIDYQTILSFINQAISRINSEADSMFPYYTMNDSAATPPFPEKWQRNLLIPFVAARIKQQDSSQFEYNDLFGEFERNLVDFKAKYIVPVAYKDAEASGSIAPDFSGHYGLEYGISSDDDFMP